MAELVITIPDDKVSGLRDAFAERFGYDVDSGLTKTQFFKNVVINWIKEEYKAQLLVQTQDSVRTTLANAEITVQIEADNTNLS